MRRAAPFVTGVVAALTAVVLAGILMPGAAPITQSDVNQTVASALASQTPGPADSELVYAAVQPSLVLIQTTTTTTPGGATGDLGSGVIVDAAGDILTSLHVVSDAATIDVTFADGTTSTAVIKSRQPADDIAVLTAATLPSQLVPATLGNPHSLPIGSEAFVVGNPFGLYGSMSSGIVSGLGRTFQLPNGGAILTGLIQVDAAVNPGNSGGPLLNRAGQVVGIVAALINPTQQGVFVGIGLAVPIDVAGAAAGLPQY